MKKKSAWILSIGCIAVFLIASGIIFVISCIPDGGDHGRVNLLLSDIEERYEFSTMRKDGRGPAIYCVGLAYSDHISIYGDYSEQEVTDILEVIHSAQERRSEKKPITVRFGSIELDDSTLYKEVTIHR